MSRENKKFVFKNPFSKKEELVDMRTNENDDYTIKRNRIVDNIIRFFSVVVAVIIWIYAVSTDVASYEFKNKEVQIVGVQEVEAQGYSVTYDLLYVTFKMQGSASKISQLQEADASVKADLSSIDLSEIVGKKNVKIPLTFEYPKDLTCMGKSQDYIEVVVSATSSGITE